MAINRVRKFREIFEVETFLNGGVYGATIAKAPHGISPGFYGLVGKVLQFKTPGPAGTVTFTASSGSNPDPNVLLLKDVKAQIQTVVSGLVVTSFENRIVFIEASPLHGVTVSGPGDATDARPLLGLASDVDSVGKFYSPPGITGTTAPFYVWIDSGNDNMHTITTFEL